MGDVPDGFKVVHTCAGRYEGCVRPRHMDLVSEFEPDPAVPMVIAERDRFVERLVAEREARNWRAHEMAKHLELPVSALKAFEAGERYPDSDTYRRIAERLGMDGAQRKFVVTLVHQIVVQATSAGDAVLEVRRRLPADLAERLKTSVVDVRRV